MSLHRSLKSRSALLRHRNVLTRRERVKKLEEEGKLTEEESVFGLPKVRVRRVKAGTKHKKAPKEAEAAEAATEEAPSEEAEPKTESKS